tara:strand:- start:307 stop:429 length:123 start_codon:yes stop_codon:yes gene_type:complete
MRPISHELAHVYITADGKIYLSKEKAKRHQRRLIAREKKK